MLNSLSSIRRTAKRGFTIIELLIAMVIVAIISAIVYTTFASVLASIETANIASEQLYTQSFLTRHIRNNFSQAHSGWQPGAVYRPISDNANTIVQVMPESLFRFEGIDNGNEDSITFTTTASIAGMGGLPGILKQVTYEIIDGSDIEMPASSPYAGFAAEGPVLRIQEVPVMSYGDSFGGQTLSRETEKLRQDAEEMGVPTPTWTFPIGAMDIQYFDGEEWLPEWDMVDQERLPWAVDFTFQWRPWGQDASEALTDDPENEFRMVIAIPGGVGIRNAAPAYGRPDLEQAAGSGNAQSTNQNNRNNNNRRNSR